MSKYTKKEIDNKLSLSYWLSNEEKRKIIRDLFREWNSRTNLSHITKEDLKEAETMLDFCAAGMELYKSKKPHKRNYKKKTFISSSYKRKTPPLHNKTYDYNYKSKSSGPKNSSSSSGCMIPIIISLSSLVLILLIIIS